MFLDGVMPILLPSYFSSPPLSAADLLDLSINSLLSEVYKALVDLDCTPSQWLCFPKSFPVQCVNG